MLDEPGSNPQTAEGHSGRRFSASGPVAAAGGVQPLVVHRICSGPAAPFHMRPQSLKSGEVMG